MLGTLNNPKTTKTSGFAARDQQTNNVQQKRSNRLWCALGWVTLRRHVGKFMANQMIRNLAPHKTKMAEEMWPQQKHVNKVN